MAEIPALIRVHARHQAEVEAHEAIFHVTVEGSSVFTGAAAFDKAKEIVRLVEAFAQHGFSREDFQLDGVRAEVSTGLLTRSSSAVYTLRIVCKKLERLPEALGELANAKQVTLDSLEWRFPDSAEQKAAWLARCVADAGVKARAIAAALPATIAGVHRVTEEGVDAIVSPPQAMMSYGGAPGASMMRAKHGPVDVGFPLTQRRTESVSIVVEYRIG